MIDLCTQLFLASQGFQIALKFYHSYLKTMGQNTFSNAYL